MTLAMSSWSLAAPVAESFPGRLEPLDQERASSVEVVVVNLISLV